MAMVAGWDVATVEEPGGGSAGGWGGETATAMAEGAAALSAVAAVTMAVSKEAEMPVEAVAARTPSG